MCFVQPGESIVQCPASERLFAIYAVCQTRGNEGEVLPLIVGHPARGHIFAQLGNGWRYLAKPVPQAWDHT